MAISAIATTSAVLYIASRWTTFCRTCEVHTAIQGANRLLKFAKLNSDVSLCYEHLCELEDLRLVTMVDAKCAFGIRRVGSSQGGYLMMLVPKTTFDGVEGPYHD